jgi:bifunctional non-homologous end joining protein LigD
VRIVPPAVPVLEPSSPTGKQWLHEVQFDGWRMQIHKQQGAVKLYSRRGVNMAKRFPGLRDACMYLPDCIIDAVLVAGDTDGKPGFRALRRAQANFCMWCFDLLAYAGEDIRARPLVERRELPRNLLIETDDDRIRFSEEFPDPLELLRVVEQMALGGVVSKRRASPYASGTRCGWIKVKSSASRETRKECGQPLQSCKETAAA